MPKYIDQHYNLLINFLFSKFNMAKFALLFPLFLSPLTCPVLQFCVLLGGIKANERTHSYCDEFQNVAFKKK